MTDRSFESTGQQGETAGHTSPLFSRRVEDQAHDLRQLAATRRGDDSPRRVATSTRVIAVTSGKGGVGKTTLVVNLAVALARMGKQVIILDCDLGTANVDVMLGMHPRYTLQHVLSRQRRLDEVMSVGPHGIRVISGGSGLQELANLTDSRREDLLSTFAALEGQADVLLLDTGAGISANVLRFVVAAGEAIVVTTPEPPAVTDAYALIKVVSQQARGALAAQSGSGQDAAAGALPDPAADLHLRLVVNQAVNEAEARETSTNIATVARRFLNIDVEAFGSIPADRAMSQAVRAQTPVVDAYPRSAAAQALEQLADRLMRSQPRSAVPAAAETRAPNGFQTVDDALRQEAGWRGGGHAASPGVAGASTQAATAGHNGADSHVPVGAASGSGGNLRGIGMFVQRFFGAGRGRTLPERGRS